MKRMKMTFKFSITVVSLYNIDIFWKTYVADILIRSLKKTRHSVTLQWNVNRIFVTFHYHFIPTQSVIPFHTNWVKVITDMNMNQFCIFSPSMCTSD
jgi:hypothetical protein